MMMKQMSHSCGQETELMNIETAHHHEEDKMRVLYEASYKGCVSTLNSLLQQDPGMLQKISSQTIFIETPLHISASHGHLEFTRALLSHKPELALERNSLRGTPLHLASAEGHIDIVKQLLEAREEACLVRDQEGRIPLHYAVIRGRRDVALELIRAMPESLKILDDNVKTVFHLCVTHNQLEMLKDLVALDNHGTHDELLVKGDSDGNNTILHLAIMLKLVETMSYLISTPKIRSEAWNLKNDMGYSAADMIHRIPKDSKSLEIQVILMESGIIKRGRREGNDVPREEDRRGKKKNKRWSLIFVFEFIDKLLKYNGNWVEDMRGNLSMVATIITTLTFQSTLNPPGSFIQQGIRPNDPDSNGTSSSNVASLAKGILGCFRYKDFHGRKHYSCPGEAVLAHRHSSDFGVFITYNTISFVASLSVALLLVSGVPLRNRFVIWLLSIGMTIALTFLLNAYFVGLDLILPYGNKKAGQVLLKATYIYNGLYGLVGICIAVKFVIWLVKKWKARLNIVERLKEKLNELRKSGDQGTGTDKVNNKSVAAS